jgi:DNA-binding CsgD family transcriptional regulator
VAAWLARTALAADDSELAPAPPRPSRTPPRRSRPWLPRQHTAEAWPAATWRAWLKRPRSTLIRGSGPGLRRPRRPGRQQGSQDQAIHYLKQALGGCCQVGADRDQARIRRRLRRLGIRRRHWSTPPARPVIGWQSLTDTEQVVAGLVAKGLNNNQVAARMYISTHTVAHHLRQAFRKFGIGSRYELIRIVIEQAASLTSTGTGD